MALPRKKKPEDAPRTRVIGYTRVSTDKQVDEGASLAAQREKLTAYAKVMEIDLVDIVEDRGVSAKTLDREGFEALKVRLENGEADGMLIAKLDRLTRSVRDLAEILEFFGERYVLLSVADQIDTRSASGRLTLNVLTSVSQWEREAISERTRDVMQHLKSEGRRFGQQPLQGAAISRINELRVSGQSLQAICNTLTREGFASKRGKQWRPETIRKVLARTNGE